MSDAQTTCLDAHFQDLSSLEVLRNFLFFVCPKPPSGTISLGDRGDSGIACCW